MTKITQLYCYPVKSLAGFSLQNAELDTFGIKHDRAWMIVDEKGQFLTQRTQHKLALIKTNIIDNQLRLSFDHSDVEIPLDFKSKESMPVQIWNDSLTAELSSKTASEWISDVLQQKCFLVRMPTSGPRINEDNAKVSFADAYPFLCCSEESLEFINQHLQKKAEMKRFRPNIVINGCNAFEEDDWQQINTSSVSLLAKKKCARCVMPTINQDKGIRDNPEILKVLNQFRKEGNKIYFGQNLIYKNPTEISSSRLNVGDEIFFK